MSRITVTEPHPTVVQNHYTHSGRGGAGNHFRAPTTTPASGVPTCPVPAPATNAHFYSGRGGAGNAHLFAKRPVLSLDDEYARHSQLEAKTVTHVGRGGAGNIYSTATTKAGTAARSSSSSSARKDSDDASSRRSSDSTSSFRAGFWGRLSSSASRH
jgi:hypothetical protein